MGCRIHDISRTIHSGSAVYPGDPPVLIHHLDDIGPDSPYRLSSFSMPTHALTHLDAPAHFAPHGLTIDQIPLERLCGPALIAKCMFQAIAPHELPPAEELCGKNLLLKTKIPMTSADRVYDTSHAFLTLESARILVDAGVNLIGIDSPDVEQHGTRDFPVHKLLAEAGILVLEGLELGRVNLSHAELMAFPLKLDGCEAAPCRAILIEELDDE